MAPKELASNAEYGAAIAALDADLKSLQVRYEQYFLGLERRQPGDDRAALRRAIMELKRERFRNTALKFRLDTLWNKLLSYERMWDRTVKEIEEGTYRRDVFKAKRRGYDVTQAKRRSGEPPQSERGADRPSGAARDKGGMTGDRVDRIYKDLVTAKRACREDVSGITREGLERSLRRQLPRLEEKHRGKQLDFKVVIQKGKAVIKAVPK